MYPLNTFACAHDGRTISLTLTCADVTSVSDLERLAFRRWQRVGDYNRFKGEVKSYLDFKIGVDFFRCKIKTRVKLKLIYYRHGFCAQGATSSTKVRRAFHTSCNYIIDEQSKNI